MNIYFNTIIPTYPIYFFLILEPKFCSLKQCISLNSLTINTLISNAITPIALIDTNLHFLTYSRQWLSLFNQTNEKDLCNSLDALIIAPPREFTEALQKSLQGLESIHTSQKFTLANGEKKWMNWKTVPWKNTENEVGGTMIFFDTIVDDNKERELLTRVGKIAKIGGWEIDLSNNEVYWTNSTKMIHEVSTDYEPQLETTIAFYKQGFYRQQFTEALSEAIKNGTDWDIESVIITAKGNEIWVRSIGKVEKHEGKHTSIVGTIQNIKAQKTSLQNPTVGSVVNNDTKIGQIGTWEYLPIKKTLKLSDTLYDALAIDKQSKDNLKTVLRTIDRADRERVFKVFKNSINTRKRVSTNLKIICADGRVKYFLVFGEPRADKQGMVSKITGISIDVTELRDNELQLAEQHLRRNTHSFLEIFKNAAVGMAIIGADNKWKKVNKRFCNSLGYTEKELRKLTVDDITYSDDVEKNNRIKKSALSNNHRGYQLEKRYIHKNGQILYVTIAVTFVRDLNGSITHLIKQILDRTEKIVASEKLNSLLDVTKNQNDSLMNFAHIVSHNLRSYSSNLSMLTKFIAKEKDENEIKHLNAMIYDAAQNLSDTMVDLNNVVQIQTNSADKLQKTNILSAYTSAKAKIHSLLKKEKATIFVDISENHFVNAVPEYLESIFLDLISNAIKYKSEERNPSIEIKTHENDKTVLITVKDNGLGIDMKRYGHKVFGMYKTFHNNDDSKGLSLFIVKNQIEAMGGKIYLESEVNAFSKFCIVLNKN